MSEALTIFLTWLLPTGGLGGLFFYITSKRKRDAIVNKEVHDTYKKMYEDVHGTLIEIQDENKKLYKAVTRLEKAIARASTCRYYDSCPINAELHEQKGNNKSQNRNRQLARKGNKACNIRADPGEPGIAKNTSS